MGEWDLYPSGTPASADTLLYRSVSSTPPAAGQVKQSTVANLAATVASTAADFAPTGLTGAVAVSRYAGATTSGAPVSGTFAVGDFVVDQAGTIWICTAAGTPGTWTSLVNTTGTQTVGGTKTFAGEVRAPDFAPSGLTGATGASRYAGATTSGAPTSGTFAVGDFVVDRTGAIWVCTVAGTPGTWVSPSGAIVLHPSGDATGVTDTPVLQAALTAAGAIRLAAGTFYVNAPLQVKSGTCLSGAGIGVTTIKMASGSWSSVAQVGLINGVSALMTYGNTTASYIAVRDLTVDGNQTGITALPAWATGGTGAGNNVTNSPLHLNHVTNLEISGVGVINSIGYTVYLQSCVNFTIRGCRVISGQVSATQGWGIPSQQDGLHLDGVSYGLIDGNYIDTGTFSSAADVGDDGIALQSLTSAVHDVTITGNAIRAGESGIDLALSGNDIYDVSITGNNIWGTQAHGIVSQPFSGTGAVSRNITVTANTITSPCATASSANGISFLDYSLISLPANAFENVSVSGNTIESITNAASAGIYFSYGTNITVASNNMRDLHGYAAVQVGNNVAGTSTPASVFSVSGNIIDISASTGGNVTGIAVKDSRTGTLSQNVIIGPGAATGGGGNVAINIGSFGAVVQGNAASGNSINGWTTGIQEYNAGASPDFNSYIGNQFQSVTTSLSLVGTHDTVLDASQNTFPGVTAFNGGTDTSGTAAASSPAFTSGTAKQLSTTQDVRLMIAIQTSAALAVAIGPANTTTTALMPSQSYALGLVTIPVPKGWWVKITGTIADLTITQLTC